MVSNHPQNLKIGFKLEAADVIRVVLDFSKEKLKI